jgi:hypothetical protein
MQTQMTIERLISPRKTPSYTYSDLMRWGIKETCRGLKARVKVHQLSAVFSGFEPGNSEESPATSDYLTNQPPVYIIVHFMNQISFENRDYTQWHRND